MKAATLAIFVVSAITITNARLKIDSILDGGDVSIGSYYSKVSIGNVTKKTTKMESTDVKASVNAIELIELLRRMFGVGIFTLPPLDPFTINKLKPLIIGPDTFISGKVSLSSLTVTGAKKFDLKLLELRTKTGRVDFEINFPTIDFTVNFKTELNFGGLIPFSVKGKVRGHIDRLRLTGALQTEVRLRKGQVPNVIYQITGVTNQIQAHDVKVALANGIHLDSDLLQSIYAGEDNSSLSQWITSIKDMINEYGVRTFISLANNVLKGLSVAQINAYLLPESN